MLIMGLLLLCWVRCYILQNRKSGNVQSWVPFIVSALLEQSRLGKILKFMSIQFLPLLSLISDSFSWSVHLLLSPYIMEREGKVENRFLLILSYTPSSNCSDFDNDTGITQFFQDQQIRFCKSALTGRT
jgi:hypothetical protein